MFRLYLSHIKALKGQIHTVSEQCIVGSPMLIMLVILLYNKEILRMAVLLLINSSYIKYRSDI
jgi:hypothetical protein